MDMQGSFTLGSTLRSRAMHFSTDAHPRIYCTCTFLLGTYNCRQTREHADNDAAPTCMLGICCMT